MNKSQMEIEKAMGNSLLVPTTTDPPSPATGTGSTPESHPTARPWYGGLLGVVFLALAFGAGWILSGGGHHEKEGLPAKVDLPHHEDDTIVVTVEPVAYRPVQRAIEAFGSLYGFEEVVISSRVEGRVRRLHHDVADRVAPDELLLEIDPTDKELAVRQAERGLQVELAKLGLDTLPEGEVDLTRVPSVMLSQTRLDNARARYERVQRLGRAIAAEETDTATNDFRAAQAEHAHQLLQARASLATIRQKQSDLAIAQQQLSDTRVNAPTPTLPVPGSNGSGVSYAITQRMATEGALVRPGTELFRLVINRVLKLRVPVPDRFSGEVKMDQPVEVTTSASPTPILGKVTRINPASDTTTRTFEVEIQVPNPDGSLKPGSFARAAIQTRLDPEAITVPLTALVQFAGITKVFVKENDRVREVPITPGMQTTEWIEIASPRLPRGTLVVTSGQMNLANDSRVSVRGEK
jgi:RND family efflux transporter MFP subunit